MRLPAPPFLWSCPWNFLLRPTVKNRFTPTRGGSTTAVCRHSEFLWPATRPDAHFSKSLRSGSHELGDFGHRHHPTLVKLDCCGHRVANFWADPRSAKRDCNIGAFDVLTVATRIRRSHTFESARILPHVTKKWPSLKLCRKGAFAPDQERRLSSDPAQQRHRPASAP